MNPNANNPYGLPYGARGGYQQGGQQSWDSYGRGGGGGGGYGQQGGYHQQGGYQQPGGYGGNQGFQGYGQGQQGGYAPQGGYDQGYNQYGYGGGFNSYESGYHQQTAPEQMNRGMANMSVGGHPKAVPRPQQPRPAKRAAQPRAAPSRAEFDRNPKSAGVIQQEHQFDDSSPEPSTQRKIKVPVQTQSTKPRVSPTAPMKKTTEQKEAERRAKKAEKSARKEKQESMKVKKKKIDPKDLPLHDPREHINIVFIGHVDAGKSTMSGQILLQMGEIDQRTIEKYEREAKEKNRESWWIAYIMDENEEERQKGKTVELGRAHFETDKKRYTILDAPGHKLYVPNMIAGAQQADVGVLIISARKGEFEAGFEGRGQTKEHSMLAYTLGIKHLIIVINKMDEKTVKWSKKRYDEIEASVRPFLVKECGFRDKNIKVLPVSAQLGINISKKLDKETCSWYDGPCLLEALDNVKKLKKRNPDGPLRVPVDVFDVSGKKTAIGKIESGTLFVGQDLVLMADQVKCSCVAISINEKPAQKAEAGENVTIQISVKGNSENVKGAFILCDLEHPTPRTLHFEAQMQLKELPEHKPLLSIGYQSVIHVHNVQSPCEVSAILHKVQKKTGRFSKKAPTFIKPGDTAVVRIKLQKRIPLEAFDTFPQLGRFTLRDEGRTIALGIVLSESEDKFGQFLEKSKLKSKEAAKKKKKKKK